MTRPPSTRRKSLLFAAAVGFVISGHVSATEFNRSVVVTSVLGLAGNRPVQPSGQNFIRIYVTAAAWGSSTCRQDAADLAKGDTHLFAQIVTAIQAGKSIALFVDDTLRPIDTVCQVTGVQVFE